MKEKDNYDQIIDKQGNDWLCEQAREAINSNDPKVKKHGLIVLALALKNQNPERVGNKNNRISQ